METSNTNQSKAPKRARKARKPSSPDVIVKRSDEYGNLLVIKNNGKRIVLSLKLASETRHRQIGVINEKQRTMTVYREPNHLHRISNSYGFNYQLLAEAKKFDFVRIIAADAEYKIPRLRILEKGVGDFLHFLGQGFERQIFVKLDELKKHQRPDKF